MIPVNSHFSFFDDDGILWIEFAACRRCSHLICNSLSAMVIGGRQVQCNGCGEWVTMFDETYFVWTDDPPEGQITSVRIS